MKVGNGKHIGMVKSGKLRGVMQQKDGSQTEVVLTDAENVPNLWCNLFSLVAAMKQGCKLSGERTDGETTLKITKGMDDDRV